jgi:hypothetical protein
MITYEIFSLAREIIDLAEICKSIDEGGKCVWRICNNLCLSEDCKLYHKICINMFIEWSCWKYLETAYVIDFVDFNLRAFNCN